MRIITGSLKGKQFDSPHSKRTHPMSDRVRGALFNTLGDISGLSVFDPFGGTGALSFEAISRGASEAVICETDKQAQKTIADNVEKLGLDDKVSFYRGTAKAWLRRNQQKQFDIVLADPPYDDIDRLLLQSAADRVKEDGVFVVSWPGKEDHLQFEGVEILQINNYGDAKLLFFRRND